ncbi:MAG TPA: ATP--guanido phosphotransferase [Bacteroidetes bacterium]|nr:ATP--guanido phosphotransferase [Bacteroidota bacterium]
MFEKQKLWDVRPKWLDGFGVYSDIVVAGRIRLARNLKNFGFPHKASQDQLEKILTQVADAVEETRKFTGLSFWWIEEFSELERQLLLERKVISPEFARKTERTALALGEWGRLSVMVNEEDHLRIQLLDTGIQLDVLWDQIQNIERLLAQKLIFSFSDDFGYLTCCPTNTGTGLRGSILLHLPALEHTGQLKSVFNEEKSFDLSIRGYFGEGSEVVGSMYQISNKLTLGLTEFNLLDGLLKIALKIVDKELKVRREFMENRNIGIQDKIFRSLGILERARLISSSEFMQHYSNLLLGIDLGYLPEINRLDLQNLFLWTQPAHLQWREGKELHALERDVMRAEIIKSELRL